MMPGLLLGERADRGEPGTERGRELGWGAPGEFTEDEEEMTVAVRGEDCTANWPKVGPEGSVDFSPAIPP